jgi:hypothetical protein
VLALPLEAESPVDKEFAEEREESHDDGNAVIISDHLYSDPSYCDSMTYPRTTTVRVG